MNKTFKSFFAFALLLFFAFSSFEKVPEPVGAETRPSVYEVRAFGAQGDGKTIDTPAINKAIDAAAANGGGTVTFSAGTYLSVSIHLKSNITLHLDQGARIVAADTVPGKVTYDPPEPNEWDRYQDFGHSQHHRSGID
jgi:hypothetical protein